MGDGYKISNWPVKKVLTGNETISVILNAIPMSENHIRPSIVLNDGCILSVQGRQEFSNVHVICECTPKTSVGPWTHLDVGFPDRMIARLMPWIKKANILGKLTQKGPDQSVYPQVPVGVLNSIIEEGEGVAGYRHGDEVVPLGQIRDGLMWVLGSYGNPVAPKLWHTGDGYTFATKKDALDFMEEERQNQGW